MNIKWIGIGLLAGLFMAPAAFAGSDTWKDCSKEVSQYCKSAKGDQETFECLEKREHLGKKKSGLSSKCNEAHEAYEQSQKKAGKYTEKDEDEAHEKHD